MTQKSDIQEMLDAGKGYDEIEDKTGSNRSYIRSIAVDHRKRAAEGGLSPEEGGEKQPPTAPPETPSETPGVNFIDDTKSPVEKTGSKTGLDHHKAWVKAAKYECGGCGATIGRSTDFCPHCGKPLSWEGVE